jgi:RHS repeat-associated protein
MPYGPYYLPTAGYTYDVNGRMSGMTWDTGNGDGPQPYANATYGPAGQILTLSYGAGTETRTYNSLLQLTSQVVPYRMNMTYNYSATQNNGRITGSVDSMTGENTAYSYDALNRLAGASNSLWSEAYGYDGFGNLTSKAGTGGSPTPAPAMSASYDSNNHQVGTSYDGNGNQLLADGNTNSYTVENRVNSQYGVAWPYAQGLNAHDPWGKRVMRQTDPDPYSYSTGSSPSLAFNFYGITGQRLATVTCVPTGGIPSCFFSGQNVYFGKKLLVSNGVNVVTDRLGSVRANLQGEGFSYYPYGEERTSTVDGRDKFGTYFRDGVGQDYADQRYYGSGTGRFWTVDHGPASLSNPLSWNRYAYVRGDPINFRDPHGMNEVAPSDGGCVVTATDEDGNATMLDCGQVFVAEGSYSSIDVNGDTDEVNLQPDPTDTNANPSPASTTLAYPPAGIPDCNGVLRNDVSTYLSGYDGGASPLNTTANIQELVSAGMTYDVDPRFIVALAVAESSAGINLTWGPFNAWNIRARSPSYTGSGKKPPYTSWGEAIDAVNDLIGGSLYFGSGLTATNTIYPVYQGPGYGTGLGNLNTALGQMGGDPSNVTDPCNSKNVRNPSQ